MDTFMDGIQGATKGEGGERYQALKLFFNLLENVVRKMIDIDIKIGQVPCQKGGDMNVARLLLSSGTVCNSNGT